MQLDCPHCGTQLIDSPSAHDSQNTAGVNQRLRGGDITCEECENAVGVYHLLPSYRVCHSNTYNVGRLTNVDGVSPVL